MEIEPVPTSLPELLRSVVANYAGSASSKGLALACEVDPRIAPAHYADPAAAAPGGRQFPVQRDQVHRGRRRHRGGGTAPARSERRRAGQRHAGGAGHRHRHRDQRAAQARLFQPFSQAEVRHHAALRRHRPGPGDQPPPRRADGRRAWRLESAPGAGTTHAPGDHPAARPAGGIAGAAAAGQAWSPASRPRRLPTIDRGGGRAQPGAAGRRPRHQPPGDPAPAGAGRVCHRSPRRTASRAWNAGAAGVMRCCSATCTCRAWTATRWRARSARKPAGAAWRAPRSWR